MNNSHAPTESRLHRMTVLTGYGVAFATVCVVCAVVIGRVFFQMDFSGPSVAKAVMWSGLVPVLIAGGAIESHHSLVIGQDQFSAEGAHEFRPRELPWHVVLPCIIAAASIFGLWRALAG